MKILKFILYAILGLIVLVLILALFVRKNYAVEKEVVINKPKTEVFSYIKLLKNQNNYSVWAKIDPNMKKEFRGTDGTVGFVSAWDSDNKDVGKGEQKIVAITDEQRVNYEIHFIKPYEGTDHAYMTTENLNDNQTRVKWGFNGKMNYPMNLMLLFMDMQKMIGNDLETGLNNLKSTLETK